MSAIGDMALVPKRGLAFRISREAAYVLFDRYADQLIALARSHLSAKMSQRIDPEDVVQSVYRSFFDRARKGTFDFESGGDIWRLLVAMTLHKLRDQVDWQTAAKRSVDAEIHFGSEDSLFGIQASAFSRNPSPLLTAVLADELTGIMQSLEPVQRRMLELRLVRDEVLLPDRVGDDHLRE